MLRRNTFQRGASTCGLISVIIAHCDVEDDNDGDGGDNDDDDDDDGGGEYDDDDGGGEYDDKMEDKHFCCNTTRLVVISIILFRHIMRYTTKLSRLSCTMDKFDIG